MTKVKIKMVDDSQLRKELDLEYDLSSQVKLCKYALLLAKHILQLINYPDAKNEIIKMGFVVNEKWQNSEARMHDVRQIAFKIHQLAKKNEDEIISTALRVVGHAVATGHMREHAMVASDYAIKVINFLYPNNIDAVKKERLWQIEQLKKIKNG